MIGRDVLKDIQSEFKLTGNVGRPLQYWGCGHRSHDKRGVAPKAVKFSNTVTEFPSRFDEDSTRTVPKPPGHKFSSGAASHSTGPGHSPGHSVPGHNPGHSSIPGHSPGHSVQGHNPGHSSIPGHSPGHSVPGHNPGHSPGHSVPGHNTLGQYNDRTGPDGESGHSKTDAARKLSADK